MGLEPVGKNATTRCLKVVIFGTNPLRPNCAMTGRHARLFIHNQWIKDREKGSGTADAV